MDVQSTRTSLILAVRYAGPGQGWYVVGRRGTDGWSWRTIAGPFTSKVGARDRLREIIASGSDPSDSCNCGPGDCGHNLVCA